MHDDALLALDVLEQVEDDEVKVVRVGGREFELVDQRRDEKIAEFILHVENHVFVDLHKRRFHNLGGGDVADIFTPVLQHVDVTYSHKYDQSVNHFCAVSLPIVVLLLWGREKCNYF